MWDLQDVKSSMPSPAAHFDCLYTANRLSSRLGAVAEGELHLFAYLACLLSLFDTQPVSDWGYTFAGLGAGAVAPFSPEIRESVELLIADGSLVRTGESSLALTDAGSAELVFLSSMSFFEGRERYLDVSCSSLRLFPVGLIRAAMGMEPGLRPVVATGGARTLLADVAIDQLHEQFDGLVSVLGPEKMDLLVPASVWLSYLSEMARKHDWELISSSVRQ